MHIWKTLLQVINFVSVFCTKNFLDGLFSFIGKIHNTKLNSVIQGISISTFRMIGKNVIMVYDVIARIRNTDCNTNILQETVETTVVNN